MRKIWFAVGGATAALVVGGAVLVRAMTAAPAAARPSPSGQRVATRTRAPSSKVPKTKTTTPPPTRQPASEAASFAAATGLPAGTALETVTPPWAPTTTWAIDPQGVRQPGWPMALWFGSRTGSGSWRWIKSQLPGALARTYPVPVYKALAEAYDLHEGQFGPSNLGGTISWQSLQGRVGEPLGWTLQALPTQGSPLFAPTVEITVWMQSQTGLYNGLYGLQTVWDAANESTGRHDIIGFQAAPAIPSP